MFCGRSLFTCLKLNNCYTTLSPKMSLPSQFLHNSCKSILEHEPWSGLGLSLTYNIIKAHGGEIKVKSDGNEGVNFTIVLPK